MIEDWGLYVLPTNFPAFSWTRVRFNIHTVVEDTHIFSPTLVNTARVGFYKEKYTDGDPLYGVTPFKGDEAVKQIGIQGVNPKGYSAEGFPRMDIAGYPSLAPSRAASGRTIMTGATRTRSPGRRAAMFSSSEASTSRSRAFPVSFRRALTAASISTARSPGTAMPTCCWVCLSPARVSIRSRTAPMLDSELGLFVQDSIKVNSRLTLDLGIRWDRFGSPTYSDGLMLNWDPATGNVIIPEASKTHISPLYPNEHHDRHRSMCRCIRTNTTSCRASAWPTGSPTRWCVRGGYGIFNETLGRYARLQGTGPFQISETYQNVITNGQPLLSFPNPFPASLAAPTSLSQSITGYPADATNGKNSPVQHYVGAAVQGYRLPAVLCRLARLRHELRHQHQQAAAQPDSVHGGAAAVSAVRRRDVLPQQRRSEVQCRTFEVMRKVGQVTFDSHWTLASSYTNYDSPRVRTWRAPMLRCSWRATVHAAQARRAERGMGNSRGKGTALHEQRPGGGQRRSGWLAVVLDRLSGDRPLLSPTLLRFRSLQYQYRRRTSQPHL